VSNRILVTGNLRATDLLSRELSGNIFAVVAAPRVNMDPSGAFSLPTTPPPLQACDELKHRSGRRLEHRRQFIENPLAVAPLRIEPPRPLASDPYPAHDPRRVSDGSKPTPVEWSVTTTPYN